MEQPKEIKAEWGEMEFAPVAEHLRRVADVLRDASLEDRLRIKQTIGTILTETEIQELKDFVGQLDKVEAAG